MSRKVSRGLNYMSLDVSFFQDRKVRKLLRRNGSSAPLVYIALLCIIYSEGYYIRWDEDVVFDLAEMTGLEESYISSVIETCLDVDLFSRGLFETESILTSLRIQQYYQVINIQSKRTSRVEEYSLLNDESPREITPEEMPITPEEIGITSEEMPSERNNSGRNASQKGLLPEKSHEKKRKERKRNNLFSSFPSSQNDEEVSEEEKEQEKIIYYLTFERNMQDACKEYRKIVAYNTGPQAKKKWDEMSDEEKQAVLQLWRQEPEKGPRYSTFFLSMWRKIYEELARGAPYEVRMEALADNVNAIVSNAGNYVLMIPDRLRGYIEEHMDIFKPIIWPEMQRMGCTRLVYQIQ